jgi:hypothetical protein
MFVTWNPNKAIVNCRKHRIAFEEAVAIFSDPLALYITDDSHSDRAF